MIISNDHFKAEVLKCDLCEDPITDRVDELSRRIEILDEIDESYESEYDKHEPRLLLCSFWQQRV